jgi:hydrogenase maturation protease
MNATPESTIDTELLVIGYGNTLRQDDSVGPRVAERIEALHLPGVRTLICDQLSPEHAEMIAHARVTVFVDAVRGAPRHVRLQPVKPGSTTQLMAHAAEPPTMLALARDVYGRAPQAWLLPIPAVRMGFGPNVSVTAQRGIDDATRTITRFAQVAL